MIKLSVNETKWSSLLAGTRALILYISISIFDFGARKVTGTFEKRAPGLKKGVENDFFGLKIGSGFGEPGGAPPPRVTLHWEISLLSVRK